MNGDPDTRAAAALQQVYTVLVGTQHPGNIGAAARALKTMGLRHLVLVAPERFPHREAEMMAAGADDVLATAVSAPALADAVGNCQLVLGCTARERRIALDTLPPRETAARALAVAQAGGKVALVFGRERTGLTNEELHLCHAAVEIPANPGYSSLNLAAAVQVMSYELRLAALGTQATPCRPEAREPPASHAQMESLFGHLGETLDAIDFHKGRTPDPALRKLRRMFLRSDLTARDIRLLRGILADAQRMARLARLAQRTGE